MEHHGTLEKSYISPFRLHLLYVAHRNNLFFGVKADITTSVTVAAETNPENV